MPETCQRPSLSDAQLVASLRATLCPACGGSKKSRHTVCGRCYGRLSPTQRLALYDELGGGYAEAVEAALDRLGVVTPHLPPAVEVSRAG